MDFSHQSILLITHYSSLYGANMSLVNVASELHKNGIDVHVICPEMGDLCELLADKGISCKVIPFETDLLSLEGGRFKSILRKYKYYLKHYLSKRKAERRISDYIKENHISLVHTNSIATKVGAIAAYRNDVPHVWHIRECLEVFYNMTVPLNFIRKRAYRYTSKFIAISEAVKNYYAVIPREKIEVIYNGIPVNEYDGSIPKNDKFIFTIVGVLQEGKRVEDAIKAFSVVQQAAPNRTELWIIGGTYPKYYSAHLIKLKKLAEECGVKDTVKFLGYIKNVDECLKQAHCGLMCSAFEGFGRVLLEYMQNKLLVIASDSGACPEIVKHDITGYLYPCGDVDALAKRMKWVYENYNDLSNIIENGYISANHDFTIEKCTGNIIKTYEAVLYDRKKIR